MACSYIANAEGNSVASEGIFWYLAQHKFG